MKSVAKLITFIFNIVIAALCVVAIYGYTMRPVWEIKATVQFNQTLLDKLTESGILPSDAAKTAAEGSTSDGTSTDTSSEDILQEILQQMAKDEIKLPITLSLSSKSFFNALTASDYAPIDDLIDKTVDEAFGEEIRSALESVKKSAAKGATKTLVKQTFNELKNSEDYKNEFGDKDFEEVLNDVGIDEATLDQKIDTVYTALSSNNTVEQATDEIIEVVNDIYDAVKNSEYGTSNPELFENFDVNDGNLKDTIAKTLVFAIEVSNGNTEISGIEDITDEMLEKGLDSTVNLSEMVDKIILKALEGMKDGEGSENSTATVKNPNTTALSAIKSNSLSIGLFGANVAEAEGEIQSESIAQSTPTTDDTTDTADAFETLKAEVKQTVKDAVSEEMKTILLTAMKVIAGVIIFFAAIWAYLLLKIIVNTLTGKMATKVKVGILFGWSPALFLSILPNALFKIFTTNNFITQKFFAGSIASLEEIGSLLTISFSSGAMIAFYAAVALFAISIPYMIFRKA